MYEITVKWPDGRSFTVDGFLREAVEPMTSLMWLSGADDVIVRCRCNDCETCRDRAVYEGI